MFAGSFNTTLDEKFRITIPAKFRIFLRSPQDREGFFVTVEGPAEARCVCLYPYSSYQRVVERARREASREGRPFRSIAVSAEFAGIDKQGRLVLPREMVVQAGLGRAVRLVGMIDWIEAWDPARWDSVEGRAEAQRPDFRTYLERPDTP